MFVNDMWYFPEERVFRRKPPQLGELNQVITRIAGGAEHVMWQHVDQPTHMKGVGPHRGRISDQATGMTSTILHYIANRHDKYNSALHS
jgi:hypothetical protein